VYFERELHHHIRTSPKLPTHPHAALDVLDRERSVAWRYEADFAFQGLRPRGVNFIHFIAAPEAAPVPAAPAAATQVKEKISEKKKRRG
jgi:hypothetical protein